MVVEKKRSPQGDRFPFLPREDAPARMRARIHRRAGRRRRMIHALAIGPGLASQLVRRRNLGRRGMIPVARVRHDQRAPDVVVVVDVVVPSLVSEPGVVAVVVVAGMLALLSAGAVVVVVAVVVDVVSLVVDVDVGEVVAVVVEPGVALAPELL